MISHNFSRDFSWKLFVIPFYFFSMTTFGDFSQSFYRSYDWDFYQRFWRSFSCKSAGVPLTNFQISVSLLTEFFSRFLQEFWPVFILKVLAEFLLRCLLELSWLYKKIVSDISQGLCPEFFWIFFLDILRNAFWNFYRSYCYYYLWSSSRDLFQSFSEAYLCSCLQVF